MSTEKCWKNSGLKMFSGSGSYFFRAVSWTHLKLSNTNDATHLSTGLNLATKQEEKKTPTKKKNIYIYILYIYTYTYTYCNIYVWQNCTQLPQNSHIFASHLPGQPPCSHPAWAAGVLGLNQNSQINIACAMIASKGSWNHSLFIRSSPNTGWQWKSTSLVASNLHL